MLHQHRLHLVGPHPEAAGLDEIVEAPVKPEAAVLVLPGRVPGVVDAPGPGSLIPLRVRPPEVRQQQSGLRLAVALRQGKVGPFCEAPGHLGTQLLARRGRMAQGGHFRHPLPGQVAVHRGRGAEGGDAVLVDNGGQLLRVEVVEVKDHDRAAHQPLAVNLAPGGLGPAGLRHGEVEPALLGLLPVFRRDRVGQGIGKVVEDALGVARGAGGEVQQHGVRGPGLLPGQGVRGGLHRL